MRRRAAAGAAQLLALSLALAGCSAKVSVGGGGGKELNTENAERLIQQQLGAQYGVPIDGVDCPARKAKKGDVFECQAMFDGQSLRLKVTQTNDDGYVEGEPVQAVIDTVKAADAFSSSIRDQTGLAVRVTCTDHKLLVADVGSTFDCGMTAADGSTRRVAVTVKDVEGNVTFQLA